MKRLQTLILLISFSSFGQGKIAPDEILYENANWYLEAMNSNDTNALPTEEDKIAVKGFAEIGKYAIQKANENFKSIIEKYPNSKHFIAALYYVGEFEYSQNKYPLSKIYFKKIIDSKDTNAQYHFIESYFILAEIAVEEKDFHLAEFYIIELEKLQPKEYWCGVARERDQFRMKFLNEKLKAGLSKK